MLRFLRHVPRPQLSYANVASTAALVLALGTGTAYAADTIASEDIIDGEVKNPDLATNAVATGKIINQGVWAQDVKLETLTGAQVEDGSLGGTEITDSSIGSVDLGFGSVTVDEIQTDAVTASAIRPNAVDDDEIEDGSVMQAEIADGAVGTGEVANSTLTGSDVANDGLTMADIAGGGTSNGHVSFTSISNGRCIEINLSINGGTAGDSVVITSKADMPNGVFMYGTEVPAPGTARGVLCNLSGSASPAITDMPVRIHTFH